MLKIQAIFFLNNHQNEKLYFKKSGLDVSGSKTANYPKSINFFQYFSFNSIHLLKSSFIMSYIKILTHCPFAWIEYF